MNKRFAQIFVLVILALSIFFFNTGCGNDNNEEYDNTVRDYAVMQKITLYNQDEDSTSNYLNLSAVNNTEGIIQSREIPAGTHTVTLPDGSVETMVLNNSSAFWIDQYYYGNSNEVKGANVSDPTGDPQYIMPYYSNIELPYNFISDGNSSPPHKKNNFFLMETWIY